MISNKGYTDEFLFFFFKQKTAYEMRISDWSSDVCSSDLLAPLFARIEDADRGIRPQVIETPLDRSRMLSDTLGIDVWLKADHLQPTGTRFGRASCRERVCQYV